MPRIEKIHSDPIISARMRAEHRDSQAKRELTVLINKLTFIRSLARAPLAGELESVQASLNRLQKLVSD